MTAAGQPYQVDRAQNNARNLGCDGAVAPVRLVVPTTKRLPDAAIAEYRAINVGTFYKDGAL